MGDRGRSPPRGSPRPFLPPAGQVVDAKKAYVANLPFDVTPHTIEMTLLWRLRRLLDQKWRQPTDNNSRMAPEAPEILVQLDIPVDPAWCRQVTLRDIRDVFEKYGEVQDVQIPESRRGTPKLPLFTVTYPSLPPLC